MRVRQLHSFLQEQNLYLPLSLENLRGMRVGIEASWWLRNIHLLKDPFGDALGGVSPGLFGVISRELENIQNFGIIPVFVFDGMIPQCQNGMFQRPADAEAAWTAVAQKMETDAQKKFALSTSRFNSDVVHFVFHFLKSLETVEVFRAPYLAAAQLCYMAEHRQVQAVLGQPGLLMFGIRRVVTVADFVNGGGEYAELDFLLNMWQITKHQFVDACILAGNEYSLTYPFLNLDKFHGGAPPFQTAIDLARQLPLTSWLNTIPDAKNREDHAHSYAVTRALLLHTPVMKMAEGRRWVVAPLNEVGVPEDLDKLVGTRLSDELYAALCSGAASHRIPQVLGTGEWLDRTPPVVDSEEYRALVHELNEYRHKALCTALMGGKTEAVTQPTFRSFSEEGRPIGTVQAERGAQLKWRVTREQICAELKRQGVDTVDMRFCLRWHSREAEINGPLIRDLDSPDEVNLADPLVFQTVATFTFLDELDYFTTEGGPTVLGDVFKDVPMFLQEQLVLAFELMKFGVLTGEPLEPVAGAKYPAAVKYGESGSGTPAERLLARIFSLCPMKYRPELWNATVDFDLANFHGLVRAINRSVRLLVEASASGLIEKASESAKEVLANNKFYNPNGAVPSDFVVGSKSNEGANTFLPAFMLPRTCLGIVCKAMLEPLPQGTTLDANLRKKFPCCVDPVKDLKVGVKFFKEVLRCVSIVADQLDAVPLLTALQEADALLDSKRKALGL